MDLSAGIDLSAGENRFELKNSFVLNAYTYRLSMLSPDGWLTSSALQAISAPYATTVKSPFSTTVATRAEYPRRQWFSMEEIYGITTD